MNEAARLLRVVTPGLGFVVTLLLLTWIGHPDTVTTWVDGDNLTPLLAGALASGGVGILISAVHHAIFSRAKVHFLARTLGHIDYAGLVARLRERLLDLRLEGDDRPQSAPTVDRPAALIVITNLLLSLSARTPRNELSAARSAQFNDMVHYTGALRLASALALLAAGVVVWPYHEWLRLGAMALAGLLLLRAHDANYEQTQFLARNYIEYTITNDLASLVAEKLTKFVAVVPRPLVQADRRGRGFLGFWRGVLGELGRSRPESHREVKSAGVQPVPD